MSLQVAGLYFLYKQHLFPKFSNLPNFKVPTPGKVFFGISAPTAGRDC
jgi:hypothetical protein